MILSPPPREGLKGSLLLVGIMGITPTGSCGSRRTLALKSVPWRGKGWGSCYCGLFPCVEFIGSPDGLGWKIPKDPKDPLVPLGSQQIPAFCLALRRSLPINEPIAGWLNKCTVHNLCNLYFHKTVREAKCNRWLRPEGFNLISAKINLQRVKVFSCYLFFLVPPLPHPISVRQNPQVISYLCTFSFL